MPIRVCLGHARRRVKIRWSSSSNLTPVPRECDYRVPMPLAGNWVERLNTDAGWYGGSNTGNQGKLFIARSGGGGGWPGLRRLSTCRRCRRMILKYDPGTSRARLRRRLLWLTTALRRLWRAMRWRTCSPAAAVRA